MTGQCSAVRAAPARARSSLGYPLCPRAARHRSGVRAFLEYDNPAAGAAYNARHDTRRPPTAGVGSKTPKHKPLATRIFLVAAQAARR